MWEKSCRVGDCYWVGGVVGGGEEGEGWGSGGGVDMDTADDVCTELPVVTDMNTGAREVFCGGAERLTGDGDATGGEGHWVGWLGGRLWNEDSKLQALDIT